MRNLVVGSLLAAVAMFVWGFLFWGLRPVDPFAHLTLAQERAVAAVLSAELPGPGVYFLPDRDALGGDASWAERHTAGPVAFVAFRPDGANPQSPVKMLMGFLHMLATAALLGVVIRLGRLPDYGARFGLAAAVGVAATFFAYVAQPIWFDLPWGHYLTRSIYDLVAWLLAGAVLAWFVRPSSG